MVCSAINHEKHMKNISGSIDFNLQFVQKILHFHFWLRLPSRLMWTIPTILQIGSAVGMQMIEIIAEHLPITFSFAVILPESIFFTALHSFSFPFVEHIFQKEL